MVHCMRGMPAMMKGCLSNTEQGHIVKRMQCTWQQVDASRLICSSLLYYQLSPLHCLLQL